ncbi:F-box only protein 15 isoform X1 [Anguilla rostrata]|uniref:F-box only protein 15 isoform X1 n=2 Tax=Anguilla rostrata TaxID=7938 RepID=UPI0030CE84C2
MATGRGRALASFRMGLEKVQQANIRIPPNTPSSTNENKEMQSDTTKKKRHGTSRKHHPKPESKGATVRLRNPVNRSQNYFERMPPEIVLKILSYLDAASLFCIGFVNKQFHELANNNAMWYRMFTNESGKMKKWKPKQTDEVAEGMNAVSIQEKPEGYWKRLYFRKMVGYNESKWKRQLKAINPYTGLPRLTEQVLRDLHVTWEITVTEKRGRECTVQQTHAYFSDSSVTVCWSNGSWPPFHQLSMLQLYGVKRVAFDCPTVNRPGWRSLIAKHDLHDIRERGRVIGSDKLVNLYHLAPGLIIGLWRGNCSVAFVMMNFHFHKLVERSLLGSSICPYTVPEDRPPFDDVDPEYGLHGYTMHILLHNTVKHIMSGHFSQLFCKTDHIRDGFIQLRAINRNDLSQHTPLSGKINLPWKTVGLDGIVQNCCMMTLTVLDEAQNPFWCVSTPVTMMLSKQESSSYDYEGERFFMKHQDSEGKIRIELVWLAEQEQFFLTNLVIYIATAKVNKHFGRQY